MDKDKTPPSLRERISAGVRGVLDPKGQAEIRAEDKAEARSAAELLTTATKNPELVAKAAEDQVKIVEKASADLKAMVVSTDTPNPTEINKIVSTAKAAEKALDAQEAALKSAQEAFDKSNPDLSKAEAVSDPAKDADFKKLSDIIDAGDKAMAAIAPARQILYDMWVQDCKEVADVIAGKKKPEDIRKPVVHTLMGALDAYSKDKDKFKLDGPQKAALDAAVTNVSIAIDKDAAVKDRFTFDEAKYNEARAKKAVIDRDSAPVQPRPDQVAKVAQKKKLDDAITAVADQKKKLGEAQGEVEQKRKELVGRVEKDATAAFDEVQKMITQLGIDARKTAPGEVLSAEDKRTRQAEVSKSWEEAMNKFQDVDPERAQEVTTSLADLTKLLFPEQVDKSGKKQAFSRLNFRSMYDNLAKNIGKYKIVKDAVGAFNSARSSLDTIVRKLNGEEVEKVKTEKDAQAWVESIKVKVKSIEDRIEVAYSSVPDDLRKNLETSLESVREGIYSILDQERLSELITICDGAATKLDAYHGNHEELESQLAKAEKYIEKATEMALVLNIARVEQMIIDLTQKADNTEDGSELSLEARRQGITAVNEAWEDVTAQFDDIDQKKKKDIEARIAALGKKLIPKQEASKEADIRILGHTPLEWSTLVPVWFARKSAEAKAAIGGVFHREAKGNKASGQAAAEKDPQSEEETRQRLTDLRTAEQVSIDRVNNAFSTLNVDKVDDFNAQLLTADLYFNSDRDRLFQLLALCEDAKDVVATYIENRAELKALLAKAQAYAKKAEEIAQRLNAERRDGGMSTPEISNGDIQRWFARVNLDLIAAKGQYDSAASEIQTLNDPVLDGSFYDQLEALDKMPGYGVGEGDLWTEARRLLNEFKASDGTPADNLKKYREVHEQLNGLILRIKDYIAAVEAIKDRLIREHSSKKAEGVDPAEAERATRAVRELIGKKDEYLSRIAQAFYGFDDKKMEEFRRKINAAMQFPDEARFSVLVSKCFRDLSGGATYNAHRAELEGIVEGLKAYAEEAEKIARELNATAANTAGNRAEAGGSPKTQEVKTNLEAIAWLNPIKERSREFSGAIQRALDSVRDRSAKVQFAQQLREHELTLDTVPNLNDIYRLFNTFDDRQNKVEFYQHNHERIERMVAAMEQYIAKANDIARKLNSPPPAGGAAGEPAPGPRREATGNNSEARANTKELQDWLDQTRIKVLDIARRSSLMLDSMSSDKREEFKKSDIYTRYKTPYDAAEKIFSDVQFGFNEVTDEFYPTAKQFNEARLRVPTLLAECETNLAAAEAEVEKRKAEQSEGDKPADKVEAKSFLDSVRPRMADLNAKVYGLETNLPKEDKTAFARSPQAETYYTALRLFNEINGWIEGTSNTTVITVTKLREARKRIPELIAQCEGPINTDSANLKKKLNQ